MKGIVIDKGNSLQKAAVYEDDRLLEFVRYPELPVNVLMEWKEKYGIRHLMYSSVAASDDPLPTALRKEFEVYMPSALRPLPIRIAYETPETLGADRLGCMVAARYLYPGRNVVVIQCGSCMTFDLLTADAVYRGGSITPGLEMRLKALHAFTSRLPLVEADMEVPLVGTTTFSSIRAGVCRGFVSECDAMIEKYITEYEDIVFILTGGDAEKVKGKLKNPTFANPYLLLYGLYKIMNYYVEK